MNTLTVFALLCATVAMSYAMMPTSRYTGRPMRDPIVAGTQRKLRAGATPRYTTKEWWFDQKLDNFGYGPEVTFQQKVLYNDDYFVEGGPIMMYAGNEGDIEVFVENSGEVWDFAKEFDGLVVFAEHRFYGDSMPFGNKSYNNRENLAHFTADQAMADFLVNIQEIKSESRIKGTKNSKVIIFGGSYGGMLASYMRMKYPNIVDGALASSAPILSLDWPCDSYARVVTQDFLKEGSQACVDNVAAVWDVINRKNETAEGRAELESIFNTCTPVEEVSMLKMYIESGLGTIAMINYPYPTDFLAPVPAWPIRVMCGYMNTDLRSDETALLTAVKNAINVYYNGSGDLDCYDISSGGEDDGDLSYSGWYYQTCTEMTISFCNDDNDFFENMPYTDAGFDEYCKETYHGVTPNRMWADITYWGHNIESASNIVWTNGLLDPWSAGGILKTPSPSQPVVIIPDGAHHLELRAAHPDDTPATIAARDVQRAWVRKWLNE